MAPALAGAQAPLPEPAPAVPAPSAPQSPVLPSPDARLDRVDITGPPPDETRERRESTAAKIVIGREEIERFGDSTLGDVLKRLPGVTIQGRPGRGGAIRLRGLGRQSFQPDGQVCATRAVQMPGQSAATRRRGGW